MPNESSELQKLFKPAEEVFNPQAQVPTENDEVLPDELKNRHIRRLEAKLQTEREASIAREARLEALSEAAKFRDETSPDELDAMVARIYGTDKPENAAATDLLTKAFKGYSERAERNAIEKFRAEQEQSEGAVDKEVKNLESYIEEIEDTYGVDLSSNQSARDKRSDYLTLLEKLSPKSNGEVIDYADPFETYELFASRQPQSRAKEFSQRGMANSRPVTNSIQEDATAKFLKEQGLLEPF